MLETMRVFVDTIELQSFSRAAAQNHLTQSAVSQKIQQLEEELGQQLILRGRGNLRATEAGRLYYNACLEILKLYERVIDEINGLRNVVSGQVRLGTITSVGLYELPRYLKIFLKDYPEASVEVEYRTSKAIYDGLIDFSLDLGIVAYPVKHHQIIAQSFRHDQLMLIVPPGHELSGQRSVTLKRLQGEPFVAFSVGVPTRKAVDKQLRAARIEVAIRHQFDNVETIKRAVEIGSGVSIVPRSTVEREMASGALDGVKLQGRGWERPLAILYKKGNALSTPAERFVEILARDVGGD
ncbi:MAG: LysR family transcriptional regulator [Candidatus Eiseniibacteriota bacterium]|jgi:DNA-binding transcriptional LysR family regulator